jgi:predicted nucleic acid-binding protein
VTSNPYLPPAGILDAVCCVHFVAANKQRVLLAILEDMGLQLLVPQEVCDEIKGRV